MTPHSYLFLRFLALALIIPIHLHAAEWAPTLVPTENHDTHSTTASVWLRCFVRVPDDMTTPAEKDLFRDSVMLSLGDVPGPVAIWLNGQKIGEAPSLAAGERRRFKVPKGILIKKAFNALALRLEGPAARAGLGLSPVLTGYFDEQALAGAWESYPGEPPPADLQPAPAQPARALFTEAGFHKSSSPLAPTEFMPGDRLTPAASLAKMTTPADLTVDLVLSEPLVAQPTHISFDERGRMWLAQYRQYPYPAGIKMVSRDQYYRSRYDRVPPAPPHHDRGRDVISVHEDTDGDGVYDKHKVVLDGLNMANSVLRGHGGFWVMHTPYLLFYPDANDDDIPDRDPEVRLAGFGLEDTHSVANGLTWGPDGWLYGGQGSTTTSRVTRPGVDPPDFPGVYVECCMIWRYQPETREYEIFALGGGNIFELDFDAQGRLHSGHNGGNTRGFHYVQGGSLLKQGVDSGKYGPWENPYSFGWLDMMKSRNPIERFTHALIVAEGTALPSRYAGRFLGADPLHRKIVVAERYPRGSTFETSDSGVALTGGDPAFRPVYLTNAPDGAIYLADFYEEFIAHGQNYQGQIDPTSGRIYRLRGVAEPLDKDFDLSHKRTAQLVELLAHPNRWHRQTAVRLLGERRDPTALSSLREALRESTEHPAALESLWALHQMGALDEPTALAALTHPQAAVRAWAIRLQGDARKLSEKFAAAVLSAAKTERDPEVRSQVVSTARRLPAPQGLPLVAAVLHHDEDIADPYIPLLCWWAIEANCERNSDAVLAATVWDSPMAQQHTLPRLMRRFAAAGSRADLLVCARLLNAAPAEDQRRALMKGFEEAFAGRALPPLPEPLIDALARSGLASRHLRVRSREPEAITEALKLVEDETAKVEERLLCARLFGEINVPAAPPVLLRVAVSSKSSELRKTALSALLLYDDPAIGAEVLRTYRQQSPDVQAAAQTLLTSRLPSAIAFLEAIAAGRIPKGTIGPATAAFLRTHADPQVAQLAAMALGPAAAAKPETRAETERIRQILASTPGDPYKGETHFMQRCGACHTLFFKGGKVGPNLTAYQRDDLGTMLISIVDPSAEIREGFVNQVITTTDGRTLSGFLTSQDAAVVVLRGLDGQDVSIPRQEIREMKASAASLMPEGLLLGLSDQELRDFFAYLRIPQPISK